MPSFSTVLRSGLLAGLAAGASASLVAILLVGPPIRAALAIESARPAGTAEHHEELFSGSTQVLGGVVAALLVGLAIGAVFAVVFARARHRLPARSDFGRAVQLAAAGFLVVSLLPGLKYPANPPGVGDPETVVARTLAYVSLVAAGIIILLAVARLDRSLLGRGWTAHSRGSTAAAAITIALGAVMLVWPANPDAIPVDIPAGLVWQFRLASLAELATLWIVLGHVFGLLVERSASRQLTAAPAA